MREIFRYTKPSQEEMDKIVSIKQFQGMTV